MNAKQANNMLISVVTPCFNVEPFLDTFFGSILGQSYPHFELICVDDCSTDGTWDKLTEYSKKDDRVRIYRRESNSGCCKIPREEAISHATGDWIVYVDADDFIDPDYLEQLVQRHQETGADLIATRSVTYQAPSEEPSIPNDQFDFSQILPPEKALELCVGGWQISGAGALTKKSANLRCHNYLNTSRSFGRDNSDELTFREIILYSTKVAFCDTTYHVLYNPGSITRRDPRNFITYKTDWDIYLLCKKHCGSNAPVTKQALAAYIVHLFRLIRREKNWHPNIVADFLKLNCSMIWQSSFSLLRKIRSSVRLIYWNHKLTKYTHEKKS